MRKFRRAARAAIDRIDDAAELPSGAVEFGKPDGGCAGRPRRRGKPFHQCRAVLLDLAGLVTEQPRDLAQHVEEGRFAVARSVGKICAAPDRLAGRREKHGQRPAAVLAKVMQRRHVDLIDVRPLLAIDFDIDEQLVHHAGGGVVLKALVRHHMAPMAGRIPDRQQDWLVGLFGRGERFRPPRPPIDRVILVLKEIRARLVGEAILVGCGCWR